MGAKTLGSKFFELKEKSDILTKEVETDLQYLLGSLLKVKASVGAHKRPKSSGGFLWKLVNLIFSLMVTMKERREVRIVRLKLPPPSFLVYISF